ncbi:MAG TPA: TlpA disulfide reductase family protein [Candidatus Thermoplasmatota archaeon]|nr:TlpA disulfide reductase family protein [Candidatus Thermoplasmatota archaeon]
MRPLPLLAAALLLAGCAAPSPPPPEGAPTWSFTDVDGATHSRDAPPGNATVLFFMATWCSTCRSKAPVLAAVHADYAARGVRFYSLDFDASETPAQIRAWQEAYRHPWPHGVDPALSVQRTFGVTSQSSVVLLDGAGRVAERWGYGQVAEPALRAALDRVLAAESS